MSEPYIFYSGFFVAILVGAFCSVVTHVFTKRRDLATKNAILDREAELRRREFLRLVVRGCRRIQRPVSPEEDPWVTYSSAVTEISAEFAMCEGDFPDGTRVQRALSAAVTLERQQVEDKARDGGETHRQILTSILADVADATGHAK